VSGYFVDSQDRLESEVEQAILTGSLSDDPYLHGLTALVCMNVGRTDDAAKFVKKIDLQYYAGMLVAVVSIFLFFIFIFFFSFFASTHYKVVF
jgi:hypothetical protein